MQYYLLVVVRYRDKKKENITWIFVWKSFVEISWKELSNPQLDVHGEYEMLLRNFNHSDWPLSNSIVLSTIIKTKLLFLHFSVLSLNVFGVQQIRTWKWKKLKEKFPISLFENMCYDFYNSLTGVLVKGND